jgi:hypothetical protein
MKETDYQTLYRLFQAFTRCENAATHQVSGDNDVAVCDAVHACFTADRTSLFLCASCLEFWQAARRMRDRSIWEMAVFLRQSRREREGA